MDKSKFFADKTLVYCYECPEAAIWNTILSFTSKTPQEPKTIEDNFNRDSSLNSASNLAWIAYGILLTGNDSSQYMPAFRIAERKNKNDQTLLFVKACIMASEEEDIDLIAETLSRACTNGFIYFHFLDTDPYFSKIKNDERIRFVRQRFTRK